MVLVLFLQCSHFDILRVSIKHGKSWLRGKCCFHPPRRRSLGGGLRAEIGGCSHSSAAYYFRLGCREAEKSPHMEGWKPNSQHIRAGIHTVVIKNNATFPPHTAFQQGDPRIKRWASKFMANHVRRLALSPIIIATSPATSAPLIPDQAIISNPCRHIRHIDAESCNMHGQSVQRTDRAAREYLGRKR